MAAREAVVRAAATAAAGSAAVAMAEAVAGWAAAVAVASRKYPQPNSKHILKQEKQLCPPKRNG